MTLFIFLAIFIVFLILAFSSGILINIAINNSIRKELKKYNYTLISFKNTSKTFTPNKRQPTPSWKKFVFVGHSSAEVTYYKEVTFRTLNDQTINSLVAIDSFLLLFHEIYFQVDLNTTLKSR